MSQSPLRKVTHIAVFAALAVHTASAQIVRAEADILSAGDEGYDGIPTNLLVIDVFVDVASTDTWTASGAWMTAHNGAQFVYFDQEPNAPGNQPGLFNPGLENRFTTFVSRPRPRNGPARFTNGGVGIAGGYLGPVPSTAPTLIDVAYFASPPVTSGSPSSDGYVARIAVDLTETGFLPQQLIISSEPPSTPVLVACDFGPGSPGFAVATFDVPYLTGIDFWVTVPEPATAVLVTFALVACIRAGRNSRRDMRNAIGLLFGLTCASTQAQIVHTEADILSPGDEGYDGIPAGLLVIDVFVDVAETDAWAAAGLIARAGNGAELQYFDADGNTPGSQPGLFNPGTANRFVTFLSRPSGRNASNRFTNGGAVAAGGYDPPSPSPATTPTLINVGYFASPPASSGSPSVDGYVARFALDISATGYQPADFIIALSEPTSPVFFTCAPIPGYPTGGFDFATYDYPFSQMFEFDFWVTVPEPATCGTAILILLASVLPRRAAMQQGEN